MGGFILISAIFSIAIFFLYPSGDFESATQRAVKAIGMGCLVGLIVLGLSECGFGGGEIDINYRR